MQAQQPLRQHNTAFASSQVSAGSLVRLASAAAIVTYASKIKNPEMRYLMMFGLIGVAASYAEGIMRERHRQERQEAKAR